VKKEQQILDLYLFLLGTNTWTRLWCQIRTWYAAIWSE